MYGLEILRKRVDRGAGYGLGISLERGLTEEQVIILRSLEGEITVEQVYGLEILAGRINIGAGNVIIWTEIRWVAGGSCP